MRKSKDWFLIHTWPNKAFTLVNRTFAWICSLKLRLQYLSTKYCDLDLMKEQNIKNVTNLLVDLQFSPDIWSFNLFIFSLSAG